MIKLIVCDVDDTLLPEGTMHLNPEYFTVIKELQKRGVTFVGASGRQKVSIRKVFEPIQNEIAYLADNGTDIVAGDFVQSMKFEDEDYVGLARDLETLNDRGFTYMPCMADWNFVDAAREDYYQVVLSYGCQAKKVPDLTALRGISKVSLYHKDGIPEDVEQMMKEHWSDKMDVCISGSCYLDFSGKDCNKGRGLAILQEHLGITYEETAAFGNADNDISMILQAKYGYAVGNASEDLKKAAFEVIGPIQQDGVLMKLKEILAEMGKEGQADESDDSRIQ